METYIMSLGTDVCMVVENGFQVPSAPLTNVEGKSFYTFNAMPKNAILIGLSDTEFQSNVFPVSQITMGQA